MKIQMDDKNYILEHINYKGSPYVGECTFVASDDLGNRFENSTRITFNADFRLLIDSRIRALEEENKRLRDKLDQMGKSTSDLKAKFIGEYKITETFFKDDGRIEYDRDFVIPWTLQKQIFKEMCEYVKNRKDEDIRP